MWKIGACVAIVALIIAASTPPALAAFFIRIGPYHLVFGAHGYRHHRHVRSRPRPTRAARPAHPVRVKGVSSALLYPQLALPTVYAFVFSSGDGSSWPFDYRSIFQTGFAKLSAQPNTQLCQQPTDLAAGTAARIRDVLEPEGAQIEQLRNLERALRAATDTVVQACPSEIPARPLARLELMESQLATITAALDMIRQPLLDFQHSLNDEQQARFAAMVAAEASSPENLGCGSTAKAVDWSIDQIDHAVRPTSAQRDALDDVKRAFAAAASDIAAHCLASLPPTVPSRLDEIATTLSVMRQAVASIRAALADFEGKLSDEQKARFNAADFGAR